MPELAELSPEWQLILQLARTPLPEACREAAAVLISAGIDWEAFQSIAREQGVSALVIHHLRGEFPAHIPPEVLERLNGDYRVMTHNGLMMAGEVARLAAAFAEKKICTVIFKGATLSAWLYDSPTLRSGGDIDLLVDPADVPRTAALLQQLNYKRLFIPDEVNIDSRLGRQMLRCTNSLMLLHRKWRINVDLHWRLSSINAEFPLATAQALPNCRQVSLQGHMIPTLPLSETLVYLCYHAAKHRWLRLSWLCDINQLITRESPDWVEVEALSRKLGVFDSVGTTLLLAGRLLGTPMPEAYRGQVKRMNRWARMSELALPDIIACTETRRGAAAVWNKFLWHWRLTGHWRSHPAVAFFLLRPTYTEWRRWRLPDRLTPLYYLLRLYTLAGRVLGLSGKGNGH